MNSKIFEDVTDLVSALDKATKIVATSGGFDPLHIGHLRCIQETIAIAKNENAKTVIIVNGDGFLYRKKGKPFMEHKERMEIIAGLEGVDYVVGWDDGSQTVTGCLDILRPSIFTKGGDRSESSKVPEFDLCEKIGCKIEFGVGGREKLQSSSTLISAAKDLDLLDPLYKPKPAKNIVDKPWGYEEILFVNNRYAVKILNILPNHRLSRQYHAFKDETIYVLEGILKLEIGEEGESETLYLQKGEVKRIAPGTIHRFCAWSGLVKLFEASTPELEDVIRLSDDYNRS